MKRNLKKIFINEINFKPPKKNYETNRTIIKSIDNSVSSDLLDMNDYGPKNNRCHKYLLVVIDKLSKIGWTLPLKNKYAQSITCFFTKY